jgi:hypothetical protein
VQDLANLLLRVWCRRDNQEPVEEVDRDTVGGLVVCPADASDTAVGGDGENGGEIGLQGAVEVGEALDVEHVNLVAIQAGGIQAIKYVPAGYRRGG